MTKHELSCPEMDACEACQTERSEVLVVEATRDGIAAHLCKACTRNALRRDPSLRTYGLID